MPTSSNNSCTAKDSCRKTEDEHEPSLVPPHRVPPSPLAPTTSAFLEAAARPPPLRSTAREPTVPGAVSVPGLLSRFFENEHDDEPDNFLDASVGDDDPWATVVHHNTNSSGTSGSGTSGSGTSGTASGNSSRPSLPLSPPRSPSFSFYGRSSTTDESRGTTDLSSIPIAAELAPTRSYNERDVEDRVAERLEAQIDAQISARLTREVDRRLSRDPRQHAIAEVVGSSDSGVEDRVAERLEAQIEAQINERLKQEVDRRLFLERACNAGSGDRHGFGPEKKENDNFEICGIRRRCWGLILCVLVLLVVGGVAGARVWFARERKAQTTGGSDPSVSRATLPPAVATDPEASAVPSADPTTRTSSPKPSPAGSAGLDEGPGSTEDPPLVANPTQSPTPSPMDSNASTTERRDQLLARIGPYIVPEDFVDNPETYFAAGAGAFRGAALDWMAGGDVETDVLATSVEVLVERYALAVLYFSTGGDRRWTDSSFFLTPGTVCDWNNDRRSQTEIIGNDSTAAKGESSPAREDTDAIGTKKGIFCAGGSPFATTIAMSDNALRGEIPWELSLLRSLVKIDFDANQLTGTIPSKLGRLGRLQALWLNTNDLTGGLPGEFANATRLASIDVENNSLSSTMPAEWGSLSDLFYASLRLNDITGTLPPEWRGLGMLEILDVSDNRLEGTLPEGLGELTEIESLYLESNRFEGPLPPSLGNLTKMANLFVDGNRLTGTVPAEYSALENLEYFWFHGNMLTGTVESTLCASDLLWTSNGTDLASDCLGSDEFPAQIECSCCSRCCDSRGENCVDNL